MTDFNKKVVFNSFIKGQFNYCPLFWMFSTRAVNHKINRLHERGLRPLPNDESSTFNDMLSKSNDATIHVKNIQKLMIEFYKYLYGLSAPIMKEVLTKDSSSITFEIVEQLFYQILKPKNTALIRCPTLEYRTNEV